MKILIFLVIFMSFNLYANDFDHPQYQQTRSGEQQHQWPHPSNDTYTVTIEDSNGNYRRFEVEGDDFPGIRNQFFTVEERMYIQQYEQNQQETICVNGYRC